MMPPLNPTQALAIFWQKVVSPTQKVLVAVSGGPDSLALLHALRQSQSRYPALVIEVAHLDHRIRGEQAAADAAFVQKYCREAGLICHLAEYEVRDFAAQAHLSVEDAARRVRYSFLGAVAAERGCKLVLTGHNADDQAETVLMRLLRGTGPSGLAGMAQLSPLPPPDPLLEKDFPAPPPNSDIQLGRPWLTVGRPEIEAYCAEQGLIPRQDETNQQSDYQRNRVRLELLPHLESYQPNFKANLTRLADLSRADQQWLDQLTEAEFMAHADRQPQQVSFDQKYFAAQPLALQRRLARRMALALKGLHNIEAGHIEASLELFSTTSDGQINLPGGLLAFRRSPRVGLTTTELAVWQPLTALLPLSGILESPDQSWQLETRLISARDAGPIPSDKFRAWLDYGKIGTALMVRPRREGDRFRPLGGPGRRKVQDVMLEARIPAHLRPVWPIVVRPAQSDGQPEAIVWIPGAAIAHDFRITEKTQEIYELRLRVISGQWSEKCRTED